MKFFNIIPFLPSDVKKMAKEYRRYSEATGQKLLMCSMTLHPEGDDPYVKPKKFIRAFDELKEELKDTDIELGILIQAFLGHGWSAYVKSLPISPLNARKNRIPCSAAANLLTAHFLRHLST